MFGSRPRSGPLLGFVVIRYLALASSLTHLSLTGRCP
jgi:hypothetical protein